MKNKIFTISWLIIALVINSCSKDDCNCNSDNSSTGGIVNVELTGESCDGIPLNESFIADKYSSSSLYQNASLSTNLGNQYFQILRYAENIESGKQIAIYITEKENVITEATISITYFEILDNQKNLFLQLGSFSTDTEITNFSYDETTGIIKGDYTVDYYCYVENTNTRKITATGDFNVKVTELLD